MSERSALRGMALLAAGWLVMGACTTASSPTGASDRTERKVTRTEGRTSKDEARREARRSQPATPEHDFAVTTFSGDTFRLSEQLGTPVVLNFWESW